MKYLVSFILSYKISSRVDFFSKLGWMVEVSVYEVINVHTSLATLNATFEISSEAKTFAILET